MSIGKFIHFVQKAYNLSTRTITTTKLRANLASVIDLVSKENISLGIGKKGKPEVLLIKNPANKNTKLSDILNLNTNSSSFDFLKKEPDIYSIKDIRTKC